MGDDADKDNGDNNAEDDADFDTDDNGTVQMTDNDAEDNAWEVKTICGTLEAKLGRGGGCWSHQGGHWGR
jgi:hypothetical protein